MNDLERDLRELLERAAEDARPTPPERVPESVRRRARRRATRTVAIGLLSVGALAGAGVLGLRALGNLPARPDVERPAGTGSGTTSVVIPGVPNDVAIGEHGLWVGTDDGEMLRLDPSTLQRTGGAKIDGGISAIAVGNDAAWAASSSQWGLVRFRATDTKSDTLGTDIRYATQVSIGPDRVWTHDGEGGVQALDLKTLEVVVSERFRVGGAGSRTSHDLAADHLGGAWLAEADYGERAGGVIHIRPDGTSSRLVLEAGPDPGPDGAYTAVAWAGGEFIYVCCDGSRRIARIDPATERIVDYPLENPGIYLEPAMTTDERFVYSSRDDGVYRLDPETGSAHRVLAVGENDFLESMTTDGETLWVLVAEDDYARRRLVRIELELREESSPRPLPPPMRSDHRSEPTGEGTFRFFPRSARVEPGIPYVFDTGHCGLTYLTDFDGSFWDPVNPNPGAEPPSVFFNEDRGTIVLIAADEALFTSSTGEEIQLRRHDGPIETSPCD